MKKLIFSLLPLVVIFSILEIGLRLSPLNKHLSPEYRLGSLFDHCVFWKPESVERNPLGIYHDHKKQFRGIFYEKKKPEDVFRVICLGGSSTLGWPLKDTKRIYPAVLEKMLNDYFTDKKIEVINAGVGGYSSFQEIAYLRNYLLEYNPDIVTICPGANDSSNNSDIHITLTDREYWEYLKEKSKKPLKLGESVLEKLKQYFVNFRVYNAIDDIIFKIRNKPKTRVPIEDFEDNMNELIELSKLNDFKILFVTEAHRNPDAIVGYIEVLRKFSDSCKNVFFVDTRPFLNKDSYFIDEMHPTYEGHEIIAQVIFDTLLEKINFNHAEIDK